MDTFDSICSPPKWIYLWLFVWLFCRLLVAWLALCDCHGRHGNSIRLAFVMCNVFGQINYRARLDCVYVWTLQMHQLPKNSHCRCVCRHCIAVYLRNVAFIWAHFEWHFIKCANRINGITWITLIFALHSGTVSAKGLLVYMSSYNV